MKTKTSLITSLLVALAALPAAGQDLFYSYNGQRVPLTADPETVLVQEAASTASAKVSAESNTKAKAAAAQSTATKLGVKSADVTYNSLPGWARVKASSLQTSGASTARAKASSMSQKAGVSFVSPVLKKPDGSTMSPTQHILVRYRDGRDPAATFTTMKTAEMVSQAQIGQSGIWKITTNLRDGYAVLALANHLTGNPDLQYASADAILTMQSHFRPTDPDYAAKSWGLRNSGQTVLRDSRGTATVRGLTGFDMQAEQAWDITKGASNVIVLVMDDGVDISHPDLNIVGAKDFSGAGTDGRHVNAFEGHGTMVAGCISSKQNNGRGSSGIAPGVRVASAKTSVTKNAQGNFDLNNSAVVAAIEWGRSLGARISNSSWGVGSGDYGDAVIDDAFLRSFQAGMIHFVASGNNALGNPSIGLPPSRTIGWPSSLPSVVAVGAASPNGVRTDFSQFGAARYGKGIDFLAPGDGIWTTDRLGAAGVVSGDYLFINGTSFASPYAAGVAALILSKEPTLTPGQIYARMVASCRDMGTAGYDNETGYGMINAYRALGGGAPADDHGNTAASARLVAAPSTTNGVLGTVTDVDMFKFTLTATRAVVIRSQSNIDTLGEVFNANGVSIGSNNDAPGTRDFGLQGTLGAGTYYVAVKGNGMSVTGAYQLIITATVVTTPIMGVVGQSSTTIADNTSTVSASAGTDYGTITTAGAVERRTFTIRNTGSGALTLSGTPLVALSGATSANFRVAMLPASTIAAGGSTSFAIEFAPSTSGASLAMVSITSNDANTSPYQFLVGGTASFPVVTDDHGNSTGTATRVYGYTSTSGRLERGGDKDVFKLVIGGYGYITVQTTGSTDTYGYLLNSSGSIINYDDDSGSGSNFGFMHYVVPGTYYIVVKGYSTSTTGAYSLSLY